VAEAKPTIVVDSGPPGAAAALFLLRASVEVPTLEAGAELDSGGQL
jgi:choline dehydrogenase-like flavoprotein